MYEIIYRDLLRETGEVPKVTCRIGMAQFAVPQDALEETGRGLFSLRSERVEGVRIRVRDLVERAGENGVNVLVFPEMAIDLNHAELLHDLLDLAQTHGMIIVPGSYHDLDTRRNVCRVLGPTGILWEQEKHIPAVMRFGKHTVEEGIVPHPARRVTVCDTSFGRMAVVICRDFLDLDLRVELKNFNPAVDIVLNPAMTPVTADFEAAHFEARRSIYAYCFFCNVAEFGNSAINTPEKDRTKRIIPPGKEDLLWKDVDLFSLRAERKKWEKLTAGREGFIQSTRGPVKSQPSSNMALESADPTDQIAPTGPTKDSAHISSIGTAHTAQPLPDDPSIAVLPFSNMSGDPEQEYFSDGLTEDIITDLSRISRLSVSARNSTFAYKGKAVDVKEVGKQLGVRFILEGSVRKSGNRVRITAQLIDTATGHHVWVERYDRELEDFFIVQDEITHSVVTALDVVLIEGEQARIWRKSTRNVTAYDLFLRGRQTWYSTWDRQGCAQGRRLYEEAIAADENFARAYVALAWILLNQYQYGWCSTPEDTLGKALELAERAISLDADQIYAYSVHSFYFLLKRQHARALKEAARISTMLPDIADLTAYLAYIQTFSGQPELGANNMEKAMRLSPLYPPWNLVILGIAQFLLNRKKEALQNLVYSLKGAPNSLMAHIWLAAVHTDLGNKAEAKAEKSLLLKSEPNLSVKPWAKRALPFKNTKDLQRVTKLLVKTGLPE